MAHQIDKCCAFILVFASTVIFGWAETFVSDIKPIIEENCLDCHDEEVKKSGIQLDNISSYKKADQELWTKIYEVVENNEMPPKKKTPLSIQNKKSLLNWIIDQQLKKRNGSIRRLNRREMGAALADVTGLPVSFEKGLPEDGKVDGFDTGSSALQDAADSISQYLEITRRAVYGLHFTPQNQPLILSKSFHDVKDVRKSLDDWKKHFIDVKPRGLAAKEQGILINPKWLGDRGEFSISVPRILMKSGIVRLKLEISCIKGDYPKIPNPHLWIEVGGDVILRKEISNPPDTPKQVELFVQVSDLPIESKGLKFQIHNKVEMPYKVNGFENDDRSRPDENIPGGTGLFRPKWDRKAIREYQKQPIPFIVLHSIELEPFYQRQWLPDEIGESSEPTEKPSTTKTQSTIQNFMSKAWRQPVSKKQTSRFLELYQNQVNAGNSHDSALRSAMHSILMSAPFRFLNSPNKSGYPFDHNAMASRMSFMLNGTPPDATLRSLARENKLDQIQIIKSEARRLLDKPQAQNFIIPFVSQWLQMDQPITIAMDHIKKQDFRFGRHLKQSMKDETYQFFTTIVTENLPATDLLQSNWTMMNNSLARFYGYDEIDNAQFQKILLKEDDPRGGGLLSHAGIQSMLTWMGENWIIYRGSWTLKNILNDPPPPPPLEVPELIPSESKGKTQRELLFMHQNNPKCSICHKKMDPLGFAFQNFDLSGRWRDLEFDTYKRDEIDGKIAWIGHGSSRPVDVTGNLPNGEEFSSYKEFKKLLLKNYSKPFLEGLMKKLYLYGTGNLPDVPAIMEIRAIINQQEESKYLMKDLISSLVASESFRY